MRVSVIGSGNVGMAFGSALIQKQHDVLFYDIIAKNPPKDGAFTMSFEEAFNFAEAVVICVPTELDKQGDCDLSIIRSVCKQFAECLQKDRSSRRMLIQKSTCPPGTADKITGWLSSEFDVHNGRDYDYVVYPSFLNMGTPVEDEMKQMKCIVGVGCADNAGYSVGKKFEELIYWVKPMFATYTEVEFAKYANNIMHASILSIWNEIFLLGQKINVDTDWVAKVTTLERGLESVYRVHGKAWGGPCLPKDTKAFISYTAELGVPMPILESVIANNQLMREHFGVRTEHWNELHSRTQS